MAGVPSTTTSRHRHERSARTDGIALPARPPRRHRPCRPGRRAPSAARWAGRAATGARSAMVPGPPPARRVLRRCAARSALSDPPPGRRPGTACSSRARRRVPAPSAPGDAPGRATRRSAIPPNAPVSGCRCPPAPARMTSPITPTSWAVTTFNRPTRSATRFSCDRSSFTPSSVVSTNACHHSTRTCVRL